ncbi:MAG TPA: CDP-diacylglycerol diphosphatase [Acetobacteraceae bacterium]|nr:CDP-diacylglycerol diphosphatase [Acetobacteraceae bacterium]
MRQSTLFLRSAVAWARARTVMRSTCLAALLVVLAVPRHAAADADALWHIISDQCVPDQQQNQSPKPCELVDLADGYVVLKDRDGDTQFLVMPTARITGIESPAILAPDAPNYWDAAWQARHYVDERARGTMPRDTISLAINSASGRTQNQLHIHIDCVSRDVQAALREHASDIGTGWTPFPVKLSGHDYMAMRIDQPDLSHANPFFLLADGIPGAREDMAHYTLVAVGDPAGLVLLAGHASGIDNRGSGEELQDHACALAH